MIFFLKRVKFWGEKKLFLPLFYFTSTIYITKWSLRHVDHQFNLVLAPKTKCVGFLTDNYMSAKKMQYTYIGHNDHYLFLNKTCVNKPIAFLKNAFHYYATLIMLFLTVIHYTAPFISSNSILVAVSFFQTKEAEYMRFCVNQNVPLS